MESLETIRNRVKKIMLAYGDEEGMDLLNDDGEGIVLDSTGYADIVGGSEQEFNIELHTIYPNLYADTNIGHINLVDMIADEDDWYTIEDVTGDILSYYQNENRGEGFQK